MFKSRGTPPSAYLLVDQNFNSADHHTSKIRISRIEPGSRNYFSACDGGNVDVGLRAACAETDTRAGWGQSTQESVATMTRTPS